MCRQAESISALNDAADALSVACLTICPDEIGRSLKSVYDEVLGEQIPAKFLEKLAELK